MAFPVTVDPLLASLEDPAALCDARGVIVACNPAFPAWAGATVGAKVEIDGARGALLLPGRPPRALLVFPTSGGGWLALPAVLEAWAPQAAVASAIERRLERVQATVEANAAMGLLEQPPDAVSQCLRETLAAAQELKALREQVSAMAGPPQGPRGAVCLRTILREALSVLPGGTRILLEDTEGDVTVEADRAQLFAHLVRLLGVLASRGSPLRVRLRGGDPVRLAMSIPPPSWPLERDPHVKATRRVLSGQGGRLLVDAGGCVTLELPAWGRAASVGPVASGGTVLIADDDESTLAMMTAVLRRAGFQVISADNGVAASALLRQHADEIVALVADAVLPGLSGLELAEEADGFEPRIPVLLVSGHPSDLLGAGGSLPLLSKPFGARALAEHVRRLVEHA